MRFIFLVLFSMTLLFAQKVSEKLILTNDKNSTSAQMHLLKLKMFFKENEEIQILQKTYALKLSIETLGEYNMLIIKPISEVKVKNALFLLLKPLFPDMFAIEEKPNIQQNITNNDSFTAKVEGMVKEIGMQWVALLILSMLGLILSIVNRRKMSTLEIIQKDLSKRQDELENEIKSLGALGV